MIQTFATVLRNEMVAAGYGRIGLACDGAFAKARPGQLQIEYYDEAQLAGLYDRLTH